MTWSVDGTTVAAHRLVMRVTREQAAASHTLAGAARRAIGSLDTMLPAAGDAWRHPLLMQEFVTQVTALAGHLDTFPGLLDGQAEQDRLRQLGWAGWYLNEISDISRAIPLLERTLADYERVLGLDHLVTLRARNNLASAYQSAGRLDDAIPLLERTLTDCERVLGGKHPLTQTVQGNLRIWPEIRDEPSSEPSAPMCKAERCEAIRQIWHLRESSPRQALSSANTRQSARHRVC